METSVRYSLKETENPYRSADTIFMSALAWKNHLMTKTKYCQALVPNPKTQIQGTGGDT